MYEYGGLFSLSCQLYLSESYNCLGQIEEDEEQVLKGWDNGSWRGTWKGIEKYSKSLCQPLITAALKLTCKDAALWCVPVHLRTVA